MPGKMSSHDSCSSNLPFLNKAFLFPFIEILITPRNRNVEGHFEKVLLHLQYYIFYHVIIFVSHGVCLPADQILLVEQIWFFLLKIPMSPLDQFGRAEGLLKQKGRSLCKGAQLLL